MPLKFEGETITIGGRAYTGTIYVETEVSNASFDHAFGTEHVINIRHYPELFYADKVSRCMAENINADAWPALCDWLNANLYRVEKRFEMECKRAV